MAKTSDTKKMAVKKTTAKKAVAKTSTAKKTSSTKATAKKITSKKSQTKKTTTAVKKGNRNSIIEDGVFTQEYTFGSPSTAASCILGSSLNGRTIWKNDSGVTLKNMYSDSEDGIQLTLEELEE